MNNTYFNSELDLPYKRATIAYEKILTGAFYDRKDYGYHLGYFAVIAL